MDSNMLCDIKATLESIQCEVASSKVQLEETIKRSQLDIQKDIAFIRGHIITKLMQENSDLRSRVSTLERRMVALERATNKHEQNHRKSNLELSGIPSNIDDSNLKKTVVEIINNVVDEKITVNDIEACHRLNNKKNPKDTIIRAKRNILDHFKSKKKALRGIGERLNLGNNTRIFVNDNLSANMRTLDFHARKLVKDGFAESSWFTGAAVKMKFKNGKHLTITHEADLYESFPSYTDFNFDTEFLDRVINNDIEEMENYDRVGDLEMMTAEMVTALNNIQLVDK